ncbi:MAG TPA: copper chaperone PCu(A)C [Rhodanobacteraceae bacterium]|nr:copper chaperone PCu(A)C [Rhodanobacteraceae bacterium]
MNRLQPVTALPAFMLLLASMSASAAGNLSVHDAWIPAPTGDTHVLSGYATLGNGGDAPLNILTVQSDAFRMTSILKTMDDRGAVSTREMIHLVIAPGETVSLQSGGMQLMLMDPRHPIVPGEKVHIVFLLGDGTRVPTDFDVVRGRGP